VTSETKDINICNHFVEKNSFRGIARVTKHALNSIYRVAEKVGKHCEKIDEEFLVDLKLEMVEADEIFSFIKNESYATQHFKCTCHSDLINKTQKLFFSKHKPFK